MAIKVHTGRFIKKMTPSSPHGYQSTHRQIYNEDDTLLPPWLSKYTQAFYNEDDTPPPPMAIKVHTGRFITKMTFDIKDVHVTCSNSDTSTALTMIRYSLPLATGFLHP